MHRFSRLSPIAALTTACLLAACGNNPDPADTGADAAPAATAAPEVSEPTQPAADSRPETAPRVSPQVETPSSSQEQVDAPIASQPGPSSTTWDMTRAHVTGQVLTVQFNVRGEQGRGVRVNSVPLDQISLIDDASAQSYSLLQEDNGRYMAAPLSSSGTNLRLSSQRDDAVVVWLKYPAPPETTQTLSLTIPGVGPFDGFAVTR